MSHTDENLAERAWRFWGRTPLYTPFIATMAAFAQQLRDEALAERTREILAKVKEQTDELGHIFCSCCGRDEERTHDMGCPVGKLVLILSEFGVSKEPANG